MTRSQASQRIASLLSALALLWCDAAFGQAEAPAEKKPLSFFDPEDGKLDMSDFLLNHKGALPVPVVITEPAVGYGGGLGLMFFSESMADAAASAKASGKGPAPPNITAIGGAYTENGTWGAGVAHFHTWDGDRYRYLGGIAKVNANLDYFGLLNQPRAYELRGVALVQQLLVRVADTRWYVGPRYVYFDSTATFKVGDAGEVGSFDKTQRIGKAGLVVDYDSRDNIFYPSRGSYAELEAQFARGGFGSTQSFNMYNARGFTWLPLARTVILGLRADTRFSTGDVPFYAQPFVDLRGVQKGRCQDRNALAAEMELRWDVTPRWSLLGFTGLGKAYGRWHDFSDASTIYSVGAGFRYMIARKLGVSIGLDVAHSKGQNAFYIQVGSAWH
ncbi:Outer membrane protein/protective antigen OMA87 [Cupriavidus necator]|uniref:Glyceraldehyde-3-phosphate dehydrogenase n=1 Tax=Cupriavidus necator (strain ATCC 17699 / DSM 428 / KCTC 22496 / NCIMB 10442 / H16 / Stanier 337) TaxID=381666 RepID=Q0KB91_CUPNH|nr:BamA/TamA family outer membrane protein [Cupriavidus necator]QCC00600.1 glyceraldehyde-3-phosphate dehydrogenase [Cupriavidus necator H16]QQB76577.1 BamA/TamA family outer membrane protein [Cupriavidus necator]WKA42467.1 BamA/TamA family outer membrane protein [Cupriavidus necator]CAJ92730.1 outer membrane protein/protective antigen OMA87 [Cupriavidus necator H16]